MTIGESVLGSAPLGANAAGGVLFIVESIGPGSFGTPNVTYQHVGLDVGISAIGSFGMPIADQHFTARNITVRPMSIGIGEFGTPSYLPNHVVESIGVGLFGTPTGAYGAYRGLVDPVLQGAFGTPTGRYGATYQVGTIGAGSFGTPTVIFNQVGVVGSIGHGSFGTPTFPRYADIPVLFVRHKTDKIVVWSP